MTHSYETQGGFIKAFHKNYGNTPSNYCIRILGRLPNNIQLISTGQRKEDDNMQVNAIENEIVFKKVMNVADKMFNLTAQGSGK